MRRLKMIWSNSCVTWKLQKQQSWKQLSFPAIKIHLLLMGATGRFHIDPHSHHTTPQVNLKCPGNKADDALLIRLL